MTGKALFCFAPAPAFKATCSDYDNFLHLNMSLFKACFFYIRKILYLFYSALQTLGIILVSSC